MSLKKKKKQYASLKKKTTTKEHWDPPAARTRKISQRHPEDGTWPPNWPATNNNNKYTTVNLDRNGTSTFWRFIYYWTWAFFMCFFSLTRGTYIIRPSLQRSTLFWPYGLFWRLEKVCLTKNFPLEDSGRYRLTIMISVHEQLVDLSIYHHHRILMNSTYPPKIDHIIYVTT